MLKESQPQRHGTFLPCSSQRPLRLWAPALQAAACVPRGTRDGTNQRWSNIHAPLGFILLPQSRHTEEKTGVFKSPPNVPFPFYCPQVVLLFHQISLTCHYPLNSSSWSCSKSILQRQSYSSSAQPSKIGRGTQPQCPLPTPQQNQTCFSPNTPCCLNPQHLDSCFLPISLPSAVLLVIQTLPIPQVTTTLASALMGQVQPRSSALALLSMPGALTDATRVICWAKVYWVPAMYQVFKQQMLESSSMQHAVCFTSSLPESQFPQIWVPLHILGAK